MNDISALKAKKEAKMARNANKAQETADLAILGGVPGPQVAQGGAETPNRRPSPKSRKSKRRAELASILSKSGQGRALAAAVGLKLPKARRIPKAKLRKRLVAALDKEFSLYIRSLWKACPFCGGGVEHVFHFVTRAKYSVRWNEGNAVGSCAGCNYRYEFDPHFAIAWLIANRGLDAYSQLVIDGNKIAKYSNEELQNKLDFIRMAHTG